MLEYVCPKSLTVINVKCIQRVIRFLYNTHKYPNGAYLAETETQSATYSRSSTTCSDTSQTLRAGLSHTSVLQCEPFCGQETVPAINALAVAQVSSLLVVSYLPAAVYADVAA